VTPEQQGDEKAQLSMERPPPVPPAPAWQRPGSYPPPPPPGHGIPPGWLPAPAPRNGLGVAAMVLGIIATVLAISFVLSMVGLVAGVLALVLGIVGLKRTKRGEAGNRKQALAGIWLGSIGTVVGVGMSVVLAIGLSSLLEPVEPRAADTVRMGETVTYDDGLEITVTADRVTAAGVWVNVRVQNGTGDQADLYGGDVSASERGGSGMSRETVGDLPSTIPVNGSAVATYRFERSQDGARGRLEIEVLPGVGYEESHWWIDPAAGAGDGNTPA
jgi:hypothetical protein